ncbi:hypothetical protein B0H14DRAFT_3458797 [Mycena olivaceomarginata]|nr:hypothetical protein B0H14DRAFT_3458797 [Mycena olivaceomarginata]
MSSPSSTPFPPHEQTAVKEEPLDLDKALKREAMHLDDGELATGRLETWLEHYRPTDHRGQRKRAEFLKRAELVVHAAARKAAKKQRVDMHTRALNAGTSKWPRPSGLAPYSENVEQRMKEQREERERLAQTHAKAHAVAAARVQRSLAPRSEAMRGGRRIFPWRHGLFHMPMAPSARPRQFPLSFWLQVAVLSYTRDRLTLARLTKTIHTAVLPLLYRDIAVTQSAADVVNTLATKTFLLPPVKTICFQDPDARVDIEQWDAIFPAMKNLTHLALAPSAFPMSPDVLTLSSNAASGTSHAFSSVGGVGSTFSTKWLPSKCFYSTEAFTDARRALCPGFTPSRVALPTLAKFAEFHITLCHLWFDKSEPLAQSNLGPVELTLFAATFSRIDTIRISAPDLLF